MKTQAAILAKLRAPLLVEEIEVPRLKRGQVLVKMKAAGVCRTQLNEVRGYRGPDPYLPHLLGHEGVGTVLTIGPGVAMVRPDDIVVVSWMKGKGLDAPGSRYRWGRRYVNAGGAAVFTQFAVVAENRVTKISKSVPVEVAAILGCAVATGVGVVRHALAVHRGSTLAVFGVGGVGAAAILAARAAGCRTIIAVDVNETKLRWAKKLGATFTVDARRQRADKAIRKYLPQGIDFAVEASGQTSAAEQAFTALDSRGVLAVAGHAETGTTFRVDPFQLIQGRRIIGTWGGQTVPERDFPVYVRAWRAGQLPIDQLVTHRFRLAEINRALSLVASGLAGRAVITIDE